MPKYWILTGLARDVSRENLRAKGTAVIYSPGSMGSLNKIQTLLRHWLRNLSISRGRLLLIFVVIVWGWDTEVAWGQGSAEAGKQKAMMCAGCHGIDGNSTNPRYPKLAGQHELYLVNALRAYQTGLRKHPSMKMLVAHLSDEDTEDLAAYYAGQTQQ
tara:strand:- start:102 stop:575 length:474 start_codon:yes stop_codon:yes gene_type:complete